MNFTKNKKAMSQVIGAVLMIALAVGLVAAVWGIINSFVSERLDKTGSCYSIIGKTHLNPDYTCYNASGNYFQVSVTFDEVELDSIFLAIVTEDSSEVFQLTNESKTMENIRPYNGEETEVSMPKPESGKTYIIDSENKPSRVQIAPRTGGTTCDVSDTIDSIATCA